ncbi:MAG: hypothetical protein KAX10_08915 [Candidatus Lokiarchaeota archaeon]|nr:hypothetical protein [Candidatus Lokiarchaeota archaeon]
MAYSAKAFVSMYPPIFIPQRHTATNILISSVSIPMTLIFIFPFKIFLQIY